MMNQRPFTTKYLEKAPAALALERSFECEIMCRQDFQRPILDVGTGDGIFASVLFNEPVDVGIDPDGSELSRAQKENAYKSLKECYGDQIPFEDGHFGSALSNSVLEHIEDLGPVLDEVHRLLKPNGSFFVTIPTDRFDENSLPNQILLFLGLKSLSKRYRKFFNKFWHHHHYYSEKEWTKLFEKHGYSVEQCIPYCSPTSCVVHELLTPFALLSAVNRRFFKKWFLFSGLRRWTSPLIGLLLRPFSPKPNQKPPKNSGLIFFHLKKPATA